jgi:hypothetical protein
MKKFWFFTIVFLGIMGATFLVKLKNSDYKYGYDSLFGVRGQFKLFRYYCGSVSLEHVEQLYAQQGFEVCEKYKNSLIEQGYGIPAVQYDIWGGKIQMHKEGSEIYFFSMGRDGKPYNCDDVSMNGKHDRGSFCPLDILKWHPTKKDVFKLKKR